MQVSGMLYGVKMLNFVGFPTAEVLGGCSPNFRQAHLGVRQCNRRDGVVGMAFELKAVCTVIGFAMNFQNAVDEIDDPDLADTEPSVQRQFCRAVVLQRRVRDLDKQKDIVLSRQSRFAIGLRAQQGEIGLRF